MSNVEWRATVGYDGYQVSNTGLVRSYWTNKKGHDSWILGYKPKILKMGNRKVCLHGDYILVPKLVMAAFGKPPKFVHFKDGDRTNCHIDYLEFSFKRQFIPK